MVLAVPQLWANPLREAELMEHEHIEIEDAGVYPGVISCIKRLQNVLKPRNVPIPLFAQPPFFRTRCFPDG